MGLLNTVAMVLMVLAAVAVTVLAQDLDAPRRGTAAAAADEGAPALTGPSLFELVLARLAEAEAAYKADVTHGAAWESLWWAWAQSTPEGVLASTGLPLYELTAAEMAAFQAELSDSRMRLVAVGIN